jgi:acyl-coenzyme A synthetase/AMP-(fatty) acid ligase
MLLPEKAIHPSVCVVTSGGEKYDSNLADSLKTVFPNASFKNIYASTEAGSLLASDGNYFRIPQKWMNLIKIQDDELIIHKSLLGDPNITAGEWYLTGDVVRYLDKDAGLFEFISRKNEMINIGGYKVNPVEVEQELRFIDGIMQSRVYAKRNSVLGNILCCEIIVSQSYVDETYVRNQLARTLQEYKIPRIVKITDMISVGRTGKTSRL